MTTPSEVRNNEPRSRYELDADGALAIAQYEMEGDVIRLTHTIVPSEVEGRGIGSRLIKGALDDIRGRGLHVDPACPFVSAYIDRHSEYRDLLA
jgi:predicted GNAT family acetyltransferase